VVRRYNRVPDEPGVNRINWDLRLEIGAGAGGRGGGGRGGGRGGVAGGGEPDTSLAALRARRRAILRDPDQAGAGVFTPSPGGIAALPGTYTVNLIVEGRTYSKPVQVTLDPRSDMTAQQLQAQYSAAVAANDILERVNRVIATVDNLTQQLTALQATLRGAPRDSGNSGANRARALTEVDSALRDLRHFRDSVLARPIAGLGYRQYPRLREEAQNVAGLVGRGLMPPTAGELLRSTELRSEADQAQMRLDGIVNTRVSRINQLLAGSPHVITPPPRIVP
jgi:hypothetical protein